jgi:NADPH-dependent curcumin reductase CurA
MNTLPSISREVRLLARPDGLPGPEHFDVASVPMPVPAEDEVLVRNRYFHVFASMRMLIAGAVEGTPFRPINPGDTLVGGAVGEVVQAPQDSTLRPGDLVSHWLGCREYAAVPAEKCSVLDDTLPYPAAYLGHGWTAYAALTRGVEIRGGDTVFVSAGASAIGSMAGQIARLLGAGRVVGSTSSPEKARRLVRELGYDAAVYRGAEPIAEQLAKAAPEGIDVFFDNVGGEQLSAAVTAARDGARFVLVGALSGQLSPDTLGTSAPAEVDTFPILLKKITIQGYSADDDADAIPEWTGLFGEWLRSGEITFPHVLMHGIENTPEALMDVMAGRHIGTVLIEL